MAFVAVPRRKCAMDHRLGMPDEQRWFMGSVLVPSDWITNWVVDSDRNTLS